MIDLHLHSKYSDGLDSPEQLINIAESSNYQLKAIALTDHDSIDGVEEFLSYGEIKNIITIPGIEISIKHEPEKDIKDVHIIGLNIDYQSTELIKSLRKQSKGRIEQKEKICNRLRKEFGFNITFNEVKALAGNNSVGRPHIVEVLMKNNPERFKEKSKKDLFKMVEP